MASIEQKSACKYGKKTKMDISRYCDNGMNFVDVLEIIFITEKTLKELSEF